MSIIYVVVRYPFGDGVAKIAHIMSLPNLHSPRTYMYIVK